LVAFVTYSNSDAFSSLPSLRKMISWIVFICSTFVCGIGLVSIMHLALFFRDIGKFPVEVTNTKFGIMSSGNKLLGCYLLGCIAWFVYSFSGLGTIIYSKNPFYYLSIPSFTFLIGTFLFAQYPLHNRMIEYKKKRIQHILKLIESVFPKGIIEVKKDQLELLERLSNLSREASKLPEWPFDLKTLLGVFSGALGAISPSLITFGFKYLLG
jgi:hypothetical protein